MKQTAAADRTMGYRRVEGESAILNLGAQQGSGEYLKKHYGIN
jgi:hypothetical protein